MLHYDLHCHSTHSDGLLPPADGRPPGGVARRRRPGAHRPRRGRRAWTRPAPPRDDAGITLVERRRAVGDLGGAHDPRRRAAASTRRTRTCAPASPPCAPGATRRARRIADALAEAGIADAFEGARAYVTSERADFAHPFRALSGRDRPCSRRQGRVQAVPDAAASRATSRTPGRRSPTRWDGSTAPAAPPSSPTRAATSSTHTDMRRLLAEFRDAGGAGVEVLSPSHTPAQNAGVRDAGARVRAEGIVRNATFTVPARAGWNSASCRRCPPASRRSGRAGDARRRPARASSAPSSSFPIAPASRPRCSATAC